MLAKVKLVETVEVSLIELNSNSCYLLQHNLQAYTPMFWRYTTLRNNSLS